MSVAIRPIKIRTWQPKRQMVKKLYLLPGYCFLLGGLVSCTSVAQPGVNFLSRSNVSITNIADIQPRRDGNSTVYLKGKVASQAPFVGSGAYELRDATGKIWILTNQTLPNRGDEMLVKGQVQYQSIPLAGKDVGEAYVQEQEQLERKPAPKGTPLLPEGTYEQ